MYAKQSNSVSVFIIMFDSTEFVEMKHCFNSIRLIAGGIRPHEYFPIFHNKPKPKIYFYTLRCKKLKLHIS